MKVEQLYTTCLAAAAYYIESEGEAVIIDPLRDPEPYLERAQADGATIKYVVETHFHADFVSGHLDLAKKSGATIVYGPTAKPNFNAHILSDGETLTIGKVTLKALHTPGHTMESTTFLLRDEEGKDHALFTGDTLFIGDVGRPDLAVKSDLSREDLASHLYDSIRNKIMPLGDIVIIYPGHGAGSACGKKMSAETQSTLGEQKKRNYALNPSLSKSEFIKEVLSGLVDPPQYFPKNAIMNKMGYESIDLVQKRGAQPLSVRAFKAAWEGENALVLDTRDQKDFTKGFIPGSIFIGIDGTFAPWVGALITDLKQPILIVAEPGREDEVVVRLARVGYDNPIGYLEGGFASWGAAGEEIDSMQEMSAKTLASKFDGKNMKVLDVRRTSEFEQQHMEGASHFPLDMINRKMNEVKTDETYYLYCGRGYRSVIAGSILKARGFDDVVNIPGGYNALLETPVKMTKFVEQTSAL